MLTHAGQAVDQVDGFWVGVLLVFVALGSIQLGRWLGHGMLWIDRRWTARRAKQQPQARPTGVTTLDLPVTTRQPSTFGLTDAELVAHAHDLVTNGGWTWEEVLQVLDLSTVRHADVD